MKDFVSFTMRNTHHFDVFFSVEADLFLFKLAICEFLSVIFPETPKGIAPNVFTKLNPHAP